MLPGPGREKGPFGRLMAEISPDIFPKIRSKATGYWREINFTHAPTLNALSVSEITARKATLAKGKLVYQG